VGELERQVAYSWQKSILKIVVGDIKIS